MLKIKANISCIFDEWACKNCGFGTLLNAVDSKNLNANWGCSSENHKKECQETKTPLNIFGKRDLVEKI